VRERSIVAVVSPDLLSKYSRLLAARSFHDRDQRQRNDSGALVSFNERASTKRAPARRVNAGFRNYSITPAARRKRRRRPRNYAEIFPRESRDEAATITIRARSSAAILALLDLTFRLLTSIDISFF